MRILIFLIITILFSQNIFAITVINEIMYKPVDNKEFIEIYSSDYKNLTNFIIEDSSGKNDTLQLAKYINSNYFLIVEDDFDYSNINASIYSIGNTIGSGLNNDDDIVILRDSKNKIIDVVSYSSKFGGDNGKSLERISFNDYSSDPSNWKESNTIGGTPGTNNSILNINFRDLTINEFLPDPTGNDDANLPNGEWIEIYNNLNQDINLEGFVLEDNSGKKITISNSNTNSLIIKKNDFSITYMNGFSGFLNNDGFEKIRLKYGNKIIDEVSYSDSKEGLSWQRINDAWKLLKPSPLKENIEEKEFNESISDIEIIKIYTGNDNSVSFGDQFEARLEIYKGDTNKNSIDVWVEKDNKKISKVTNFNVYHKFVNYTINVPLILDPNCNNKYEEGTYKLIVEGLDVKDEKDIKVEGFDDKLCNKKIEDKKSSENFVTTTSKIDEKEDSSETIIKNDVESNIQGKVIYESSDVKAKNSGSYILIITLLLTIIVILFRKSL